MTIVPTAERRDPGLTATGPITSVIVDSQLVDVDGPGTSWCATVVDRPERGPEQLRQEIKEPIERLLARLEKPATAEGNVEPPVGIEPTTCSLRAIYGRTVYSPAKTLLGPERDCSNYPLWPTTTSRRSAGSADRRGPAYHGAPDQHGEAAPASWTAWLTTRLTSCCAWPPICTLRRSHTRRCRRSSAWVRWSIRRLRAPTRCWTTSAGSLPVCTPTGTGGPVRAP